MPTVSEICCPTHCAMGKMEILKIISEIINISNTTDIRTDCLKIFCPNPTVEICF